MMRLPAAERLERFRAAANDLPGIDTSVYVDAGRALTDPILGMGPRGARIAFFGRDPGRDEVYRGVPFIGAGGRQLRQVLHQRQTQRPLSTQAEAIEAGEPYFWANTVPYKPLGNKAWSMPIKRRFQPIIAELLLSEWDGQDVITLGREAFFWFAIHQPKAVGEALKAHWQNPNRFSQSLSIPFQADSGDQRQLRLHPLPHPSPLNARWFARFPALLADRLETLETAP